MSKPLGLTRLLLLSSALVAPAAARAQSAPSGSPSTSSQVSTPSVDDPRTNEEAAQDDQPGQDEEQPEISIPGGGEIVVTGRRNANIARGADQVVSVLTSEDIARTGEGDIAGALSRVTGLSVVGNGFVYVRGLGDRYSLALLNGSPLPSPEPLRRVVPLDLFPTSIISSSLVQKSYSVNFPGEYGGGVINLTTKTAPPESFLTVSGSVGGDTYTTGNLGYVYYGSRSDFTGFDNGSRDVTPALQSFFDSGQRLSTLSLEEQGTIARTLVNGNNAVVQTNENIPVNWGANLTGGTSFNLGGDVDLGVIASVGISNKFRTRTTTQQYASLPDLSQLATDFQRVITDDRIVVNGLVGLGLNFGRNSIRWTNLYIRDTLKQTRFGLGTNTYTFLGADFLQQDTAWYERQLIDSQLVGEFRTDIGLSVDWRLAYANSQREAPEELSFTYGRTNNAADPYGDVFVNFLGTSNRPGTATIAYSDLDEDLWSGGLDVGYAFFEGVTATVGYAFQDTNRLSERREFQFRSSNPNNFPAAVFRPDYLLEPVVVDYYDVGLIETTETSIPKYRARLRNDAGYLKLNADITATLSLDAGVRYETADQNVRSVPVFTDQVSQIATQIDRDYWLPAATLTWQLTPELQARASASKTIARPQFRELIFQTYYDPETNRQFRGNPRLTDSQLYNAEGRLEWYFAPKQHVSVAGFFKRLDHPIETYLSPIGDSNYETSFANAPRANLYGGEFELEKRFDLSKIGGGFFASREAVVIGNYTYTSSKIGVQDGDVTVTSGQTVPASAVFSDGSPLTGQSDHVANLELGLENDDHLSQQTLLLSYASRRVTSRGVGVQPDVYEYPGFHLDFVARQGITLAGVELEAKFEARNITGTRYNEYQDNGTTRVYFNRYDVGRAFQLGLGVKF